MYKAPAVLEELEGEDWHKVFGIDKSERGEWDSKRKYYVTEMQDAIRKQEALRQTELEKRRKETARRKRKNDSASDEEEEDDGEDALSPYYPRYKTANSC